MGPHRTPADAYDDIVVQAQRMNLSCDEDLVMCVRLVGQVRGAMNRNDIAEMLRHATALSILAREIEKRLSIADSSRRAAYAVLEAGQK